MKRFHVHLHIDDLAENIRFYSTLFGAEPAVRHADYAKWMLDDPRLNFALSTGGSGHGVSHLGLQVDEPGELADIAARGRSAGLDSREERQAACCYARSNKHWFSDPQGIVWEAFETTGQIGNDGEDRGSDVEERRACCA
ncbi:MAG: VOC family protein [Gammaproteobacteria bacterium]|nr:VOC family protein [Gammaproteobacteria bacterium]